ncbi:MAG: ribonuclease P protein component [Candidatus Zixiibacteriota bacterium]
MCPSPVRNNSGAGDITPRARFPRAVSLKSRGQIREALKSSRRRSGENLTVFYNVRPSAAEGPSELTDGPVRWVFMVPRRVGCAVKRNRIRRRLRECARLWTERHRLSGEIMVRFEPRGRKSRISAGSDVRRRDPLGSEALQLLNGVMGGPNCD